MTTPEDLLAEAERLDREATPGPWEVSRVPHEERPCTHEVCDLVNDAWIVASRPLAQWENDARYIARARTLLPALTRRAREHDETIRRLSLALAEEQARTANLRASLEAVRAALGDAAGQTGTLAEDVAALVNVVESVRGLAGMFRTGAEACARNAAASPLEVNRAKWGKAEDVWGRAADELERALIAGRKEG